MKTARCLLFMMFLFSPLVWAQTEAHEVAVANWGVQAEPSVVKKAFSKDAVRDFIGAFTHATEGVTLSFMPYIREVKINDFGWSEVQKLKSTLPGALGSIGAIQWADVDADGVYELLVTLDMSGRLFYNNLIIMKQLAGTFREQSIYVENVNLFMESVDELRKSHGGYSTICDTGCAIVSSDLDHDGMLELIVPVEIGGRRGAWCPTPLWPSIYKWEDRGYVTADHKFKNFYSEVYLPDMDRKIQSSSKGKTEAEQDLDEEVTTEWVIRDRIVRFLGIDSLAGLQRAIRWAGSTNIVARMNAAFVFGEILARDSSRYLEALASDPDLNVRTYAQRMQRMRSEKERE